MHALVLTVALVPFARYAALDLLVHRRERRPPLAEDAVHVLLGVLQGFAIAFAFTASAPLLALACVGVSAAGAVDEFAFHHDLPARESDLHAKAHFALFAFVSVGFALALLRDPMATLRAAAHEAP